jgi:hypothetical protein
MPENCPFCQALVPPGSYFCPNCGKQIQAKPLSTSVMKQIGVYALSFFLPPLGLWPGIKYLRQKDSKAKMIGWVAIILTVISTVISLILYVQLMHSLTQALNSQLNTYQQLP